MNYLVPPEKSRASRKPALTSREICRGSAIFQNRVVYFESHLELMVLFMLAVRPETVTIEEQPPAVVYWDGETYRHHTFDYRVFERDESQVLVDVKPAARVLRSGILTQHRMISEQLPPGPVKALHLVTDEDFTRADRYNATMAFDFFRFPVAEHDEALTQLAAEMTGAVQIADLVKVSGLGAMAFRSIVRLIFSGVFVKVNPAERITHDTFIRSASQASALPTS